MLTLGPLNRLDGVRHGFFSREGGVSEGLYASLNCGLGSGDKAENVLANRARAAGEIDIDPDSLITCYQVHSAEVVRVEAPWTRDRLPKADAMVTRQRGIALGILTADCAPILLADGQARIIGAAHAGWRGALGGVIGATVAAMVELGAEAKRIVAGIGPCIAQRSYEVGPEFPAPFLAANPANSVLFAPCAANGKYLFDLRGFVAGELGRAGVSQVYDLPHDTCREERFFSYRRACQRGEKDYGRALSAIALEP
ncbi:MAG TPA: peptidoglycan editing factor PgeF [Alphaproteobacteria bacterium]